MVNSKYYRKHQRNCNILLSIHLMASKLLYLLMDWKTLEQVRGLIRALQPSMALIYGHQLFLQKV